MSNDAIVTASVLLNLILAVAPQTASVPTAFDPNAYGSADFRVSVHDYSHGSVGIRVAHAKRINSSAAIAPEYCRAWLEVRNGSSLRQVYYDDIAPVGGYYGIFVPTTQPLKDYFIAVKEGDYDGRLLLVGRGGSITDLPGGPFFVTQDGRYLIGVHSVDGGTPIVVVDTATRQVILDGGPEGQTAVVNNWYLGSDGYFFMEPDESDSSVPQRDKDGVAYRLDLVHRKIVRVAVPRQVGASARRLPYQIRFQGTADCASASR